MNADSLRTLVDCRDSSAGDVSGRNGHDVVYMYLACIVQVDDGIGGRSILLETLPGYLRTVGAQLCRKIMQARCDHLVAYVTTCKKVERRASLEHEQPPCALDWYGSARLHALPQGIGE